MKAARILLAFLTLWSFAFADKDIWITEVQGNFESVAREIEEGSTIHLGPGVYLTENGWALKPFCRVIGSGWQNTTIKWKKGRPDGGVVISGDIRRDGNNYISDLTVDASFLEVKADLTSQQSMQGIFLFGSNNTIERVRVIDFGGTFLKEKEAFGIAITGAAVPTRDVFNAHIRDCIVIGGSGNYDNAIVVSPGEDTRVFGSVVEGNYVENMVGVGHASAFGMFSGVLRNNTSFNCNNAYYSESVQGLLIEGNSFFRTLKVGIESWGAERNRDLQILGNYFELADQATAIRLYEIKGFAMSNLLIEGNTFSGKGVGLSIPQLAGRTQSILNNFWDQRMIVQMFAPDSIRVGNRIPQIPDNPLTLPPKIPKAWKQQLRK